MWQNYKKKEQWQETQKFCLVWNDRWEHASQKGSKIKSRKEQREKKNYSEKFPLYHFLSLLSGSFPQVCGSPLPCSTNINSLSSSMSPLDKHSYPYLFNRLMVFLTAAAQAVHCTTPEENIQHRQKYNGIPWSYILQMSEHSWAKSYSWYSKNTYYRNYTMEYSSRNTLFLWLLWYCIILWFLSTVSKYDFSVPLPPYSEWQSAYSRSPKPQSSALSFSYNNK